MGPKPETFRRNVCVIAALAVCARLLITAASWRHLQELDQDSARLARGQEVLAALSSVRSDLAAAQAAEAAYLLTGDKDDLDDFGAAQSSARRQLAHAWTLAADDAAVAARLSDVARLVDQRFELSGIAAGARRHGLDLARARVVLKLGKDGTEKAVAAVDQARLAETTALETRADAHQKDLERTLRGIAWVAFVSIAAVVLVALWLLPTFDDQLAQRAALRPERSSTRAG